MLFGLLLATLPAFSRHAARRGITAFLDGRSALTDDGREHFADFEGRLREHISAASPPPTPPSVEREIVVRVISHDFKMPRISMLHTMDITSLASAPFSACRHVTRSVALPARWRRRRVVAGCIRAFVPQFEPHAHRRRPDERPALYAFIYAGRVIAAEAISRAR